MAIGSKKPVVMGEQLGQPGGVATLGADGKLAESQCPTADGVKLADGTTIAAALAAETAARKKAVSDEAAERTKELAKKTSVVIPSAVGNLAALTADGQLSDSGTRVCNPNLLDNWYFGRPVNQRGKTEYTGDWIYTIDRWQLSNGGSVKIDNGVTIGGDYLFEPLPLDIVDSIRGKLVTASILLASNELRYATATVPATLGSWDAIVGGNNGFSLQGTGETSERLWFLISAKNKVLAAKLELGDTQTLAHKENGVWVLNEIPDFGEQLRRCLRHDYILGIDGQNCPIGIGTVYSNDGVVCDIQLPEYMRTNPAVVLSGGVQIRFSATQNLMATSVLNYGFSGDKVQLYFPGLSGLTPGQSCDLYTQTNSRLEFNSNL